MDCMAHNEKSYMCAHISINWLLKTDIFDFFRLSYQNQEVRNGLVRPFLKTIGI